MDPNNVYRKFVETGTEWADRTGAADLLEVKAKGMRNQALLDAKARGMTLGEAEAYSHADETVLEAYGEAAQARMEANRARVRYDAIKALFDAQRTAEATHRAAARGAT